MQRPLQEHIALLEKKIQILSGRATDMSRTASERYQATVDLDIAERALAQFRSAFELELKIET
jgi:hypothetical protein